MTPWLLLLAIAASPTPSPLPSPSASPPAAVPSVAETEALARHWSAFAIADAGGDAGARNRALGDLKTLRRVRNIPRLETAALALGSMAEEKQARGDSDAAAALAGAARALDPIAPRPGAAASVTSPTNVRKVLAVLALVLALGLGLVLGAGLLARYVPLLFHDMDERLGHIVGRPLARALTVLLLGLPVLLLQGFGFLPYWWAALLFVYMTWVERGWTLAALVLGIVAVPGLDAIEGRIGTAETPLMRAGRVALDGIASPYQIAQIERAAKERPADRDLALVVALQHRRAGRDQQAKAAYEELLKVAPGDPRMLNDLGNLSYAYGDYAAAIERYDEALASATGETRAVVLSNKSLAHQQRFEFDKARDVSAEADALRSAWLSARAALFAGEQNQPAVVLDLVPEEHGFIGRLADPEANHPLWRSFTNRFAAALGIGILVALVSNALRGKARKTVRCQMCGTVFCGLCNVGKPAESLCSQCYHLFAVRTGISAKAKAAKLSAVRSEDRNRSWTYGLLSALAPGSGHVFAGRPSAGAVLGTVFTLGLALYFLADRLLPQWNDAPVLGLGRVAFYGIAAAAVTWLAAQLLKPRLKGTLSFRSHAAASAR